MKSYYSNQLLKNQQKTRGFTLIELLVVISIIGLFSALVVPNFMGVRQRARDTQRKSDLKQIQKALEMYKDNHSPPSYPSDTDFNSITCGREWSETIGGHQVIYMSKFPCDPLDGSKYTYIRDSVDDLKYTLKACLENKADSQGQSGTTCNWLGYSETGIEYELTQP